MDNNLNETEINVNQNSVVQVDISNDSSVDVGVSAERSVIRGVDGFSPIAKVTQETNGAKITITDVDGTTTAKAFNGARGEKGEQGEQGVAGSDGFSPIATVTKSGDTATISITDKNGTTTASVSDGTDGTNGTNGQDGFSPIATVTKSGDTATITITDKLGTTTANISDGTNGTNGQNGADGFSPVANVSQSGGVTTISITDKVGTTTSSITIPTKTSDLTNDGANNTSTYVEASSLATVATSGSYPDLHNRPTIGNGKITIQRNSTEIDNFTVNQTGNKTINISVPTKTSDLTNDGSSGSSTYIEASSLATVATTGAYSDLSGTPTIPTKTSDLTNDGSSGSSTYLQASDMATTNVTSSVSTGTGVAINASGRIVTVGNIVIINADITLSSSVSAYGTILSSLPTRSPDSSVYLSILDTGNANKAYRAYYESGKIKARETMPAGSYTINFVYVKG